MCSNNILNFQESTTILNACTKKSGNLLKAPRMRQIESLLIAAKNNAIRTNIKARIDKTQQNSKCRLCGDREETINPIVRECSKLAQKEYKTTRLNKPGDPL